MNQKIIIFGGGYRNKLILLYNSFRRINFLFKFKLDSNGAGLDCNCNNGNPGCMPVVMPMDENIMRMSCMKFTRSCAAFPNFECNLGK